MDNKFLEQIAELSGINKEKIINSYNAFIDAINEIGGSVEKEKKEDVLRDQKDVARDGEKHTPYFDMFDEDDLYHNYADTDSLAARLDKLYKNKQICIVDIIEEELAEALENDDNLIYMARPSPMLVYRYELESPELYGDILRSNIFNSMLRFLAEDTGFSSVRTELVEETRRKLIFDIQFIF